MGRMLEAFRQSGGDPPTAEREPEVFVDDAAGQDTPYIEVGGRPSRVEASPSVLAAAPRRQAAPAEAAPARPEHPFRNVAFRPLPSGPRPLGPPEERFVPELVVFHQPGHPVSDQYRQLVEGLAGQMPRARSQVLLFTALGEGVGTTTVVLNVAISFARNGGLRVAVVDAHFRRPAVAGRLGLPEAPGLSDVLADSLPLSEALRESGLPGLTVLTAGSRRADPGVRTGAPSLQPVWIQLRERFDLVLVDAPGWDGGQDVLPLGAVCDAAFLVIPQGETGSPKVKHVIEAMREHEFGLLGCISTGA